MLLMPVFAANGDYGMTSGSDPNLQHTATATQVSATTTPVAETATPIPPTATPVAVATVGDCPDGYIWQPNLGYCVTQTTLDENRRHTDN